MHYVSRSTSPNGPLLPARMSCVTAIAARPKSWPNRTKYTVPASPRAEATRKLVAGDAMKSQRKARCPGQPQLPARSLLPSTHPTERPAESGDRHDHIPDQIIEAKGRRLPAFGGQIHDQRFARRLAKLLQPSNHKRDDHDPERPRQAGPAGTE